jgi:hypothetical protein
LNDKEDDISIEESFQKHYAAGPSQYDPMTLEPLDEAGRERAKVVFEALADMIRDGLVEVVGEKDGKPLYRGTGLLRADHEAGNLARYH